MSNFSGKELNAWRLTKRESRLFPPDSLKFHSFVVEAGSQLRCGRKGSPHAAKSRRGAGRVTVSRQLTYCGCHVENVDIASAVRLCSGGDGCIPDCGCHFGESSEATVGTAAFTSRKERQMQQTSRAMKRRADSVPRPRKVLKTSVCQVPVTQKRTSADTSGVSLLQPSMIKDCGVAVPNDSPSKPSEQKRGKGKLVADRALLLRIPSVHLRRLPAEVIECYLSRPTVLLSRLCDRLHRCQNVSCSQESPVRSPRSPGKRSKPDPKPEELERSNTRVCGPSIQDRGARAVDVNSREKSAEEDATETPARESRLHSEYEPRPEDSERRKKGSGDLKAKDESNSSSSKALGADSSKKSAKKEPPAMSASESPARSKSEPRPESPGKRKKSGCDPSPEGKLKSGSTIVAGVADTVGTPQKDASETPVRESRLRSKSEPRPEDLQRRKKSSSDLKGVDKSKSSSTNSLSPGGSGKSAQKVTRQGVANQNALSPVRNLHSKSPAKLERLLITRKRFRKSGEVGSEAAKDASSKSVNAGTCKAEEQVSRHPVTWASTPSASALAKSSELKSLIKSGDVFAEGMNYSALLKVSRLPELTNNNRSTDTTNELVPKTHSPASTGLLQNGVRIRPELRPFRIGRGKQRHGETGIGQPVSRTEDRKEAGPTDGDNNSALKACSPTSARMPQRDLETTPEVKTFKRTRGRPKHDETKNGKSEERPEDHNEDGSPCQDRISALEVNSQVPSSTSLANSETKLQQQTLETGREKSGSHQKTSKESISHKAKENDEHVVTVGDKTCALKMHSATSPGECLKDLESTTEDKSLKRKRGRPRHDETDIGRSLEIPKEHNKDRDQNLAPETHSATSPGESQKDSMSTPEDKSLKRKRGRPRRDETDIGRSLAIPKDLNEDRGQILAPETPSATSPGESLKDLQSTPEDKSLKRKRGRPRCDETDIGEDRDQNLAAETHSAASPGESQKDLMSTPEDKSLKRKRGRPRRDETDIGCSLAIPKDLNEDRDQNLAAEAPVTSPSASGKRFKPDTKLEQLERRRTRASDLNTEDQIESRNRDAVDANISIKKKSAQEVPSATSVPESGRRSKSESRPEDSERRTRSSGGLTTVNMSKSSSMNLLTADVKRKSPKTEHPVDSPRESRTRSKSEPRPECLEKRKRSGTGVKTEDKVESPSTDLARDDNRTTTKEVHSQQAGKSSKPAPKREDSGRRKSRSDELTAAAVAPVEGAAVTSASILQKRLKPDLKQDHLNSKKMKRSSDRDENRHEESVNTASSIKPTQKESPVTSENNSRLRSKSEPRPEDLERQKKTSSDLKTVDKSKNSSTNSSIADGSGKSAQKESPVSSVAGPRRHSKSELNAEGLERRTRSSSGPRTEDKDRSPAANSGARKSARKEAPVTSPTEPRRHSKSETRAEGPEKRTRSSSGLRAGDRDGSPAANAGTEKSPQKEAPVTSPTGPRRRSKSESRAEGPEKRTRSSSGPRTEDKDRSPAANSVRTADARKSLQKEAPVTSPTKPRGRSKSEPRPEGPEKRTRSSSGPRTEDKDRSPAGNSISAAGARKSSQKEVPVTSPTEPRRRSESELRAEVPDTRTRRISGPRTEDKVRSSAANSIDAADARKSSQKEVPVTSPAELRRRSKSEPKAEGPGKRTRSGSGPRTEDKVMSPAANAISAAGAGKSLQKEAAAVPARVYRRRSKSDLRAESSEKRNRRNSDVGAQVESPSRGIVNGDVDGKSAQKETLTTPPREYRRRSKSVPRPEGPEEKKSSNTDPDVTVEKEAAAGPARVYSRRSKSEPRPEASEKRNRRNSDTAAQVESPSSGIVNGDVDVKSAQKMPTEYLKKTSQYSNGTSETEELGKEKLKRNVRDTETKSAVEKLGPKSENNTVERQSSGTLRGTSPVHLKSRLAEERWKKRREMGNECRTQTTVLNGDQEYNDKSPIVANENSTHQILPKAHTDLSVHTREIELRHPASKLLNKYPSKLERLKAKRHQNYNSNKPRDFYPTSPYHGDSHVRPPQKMLESLAPSPSCISLRSVLSESLTSLNSLSSEGTEIESPAYEPLGSSPICMQNLRDYPEEIQKAQVISPSCRSDCCTLRPSQGSTSSPPRMQMTSKAAIRRLSDVFDALPPAPECGTANWQLAEEQRQKCLAAVEEDGNATPCHEVDSSFLEEWSKSVREADQVAKAGYVAKYSKKSVDHESTPGRVPIPSDGGKRLVSPQKLISPSPINQKLHNIAVNKQLLLGWEPLQSPSNCDPSCESDDAVVLDINDCESSDTEDDCVITEVRPRSSLSSVHRTPPPYPREDPDISTKVIRRTNLGKSLTDIRPEQQMDTSGSSKVEVECASSPKKWQHCNTSQFLASTSSQCHCRRKDVLRRCRSASPRLNHVVSCSISEEDDDDEEYVPCDATTISRLQQIDERIQRLENSSPSMNPLWRHRRDSNALSLEDGGARKVQSVGDEEDIGDKDDSDESVIVLDQPDRCFSPKSPSCPPPDLDVKRLSPAQCGSLTVENVAEHNRFLKSSCASPPMSVCGMSDSDGGESLHSVTRTTFTPGNMSPWESSFAGASTVGLTGVSNCNSLASRCRSRCSSKNDDTNNIDLPTCSNPKTQTMTVQRNGAEMLYLFASPSSCASEEISPIFNRRRNSSHKGGESSVTCNGPPRSVRDVQEVPTRDYISQSSAPDLSTPRTDGVSCRSPDDVEEVEDFLSPESGVNILSEGELGRRNLTTPTGRRTRLFSPPPARLRTPPYSTDEQSSESSMEMRHSVSSLEKSMLLHLYEEMRREPPSEDPAVRDGDDKDSAGNDSICVDGSHSSSDSEDLDAERKDTDAEVVAEGFGLQITRGDLATLSGTNWLNDKIVNFYLKLLTERGRQNREPEVYAYDTFFFPKLIKCGFQSVKKWTRVVDVFKHDILIIPVHLGTHWCMTSVDFRKQTIVYYDSMGGQNESCLKTIWDYLHQECVERSVEPLCEEVWQLRCAKDIPMQENNSDCGVFMCKYAECITRDAGLDFSQSDMPAIRLDMMEEIRTMKLLHH